MPQQQQVPVDQRDYKVKDPELFTGDPEDLERFLLQVDNKFEIHAEILPRCIWHGVRLQDAERGLAGGL